VEVRRLLAAAHLASNAELVERDGRFTVAGDPTEGALKVAARKAASRTRASRAVHARGELPFSAERKLMSTAHADAMRDGDRVLFVKGAPDVLLAHCAFERRGGEEAVLAGARREAIARAVDGLAGEALRTLGVAYGGCPPAMARSSCPARGGAVWLGVVGMIDPPRPEARDAVAAAQKAGSRC